LTGCHHNRKAGGYHCHRGPLAGQHFKSKAEAHDRSAASTEIKGIPRVTDGDTIRIGKIRIRLHGIDAPEQRQKCMADGKKWACGREATFALARAIVKHWVTCIPKDKDRYGRVVAVCKAGDTDFGEWMVKRGWALAYRRYSRDYVQAEQAAKAEGAGMWRGEFMQPWEWRRARRSKK
jgi:endonuclease YncB( thermonuclease family)